MEKIEKIYGTNGIGLYTKIIGNGEPLLMLPGLSAGLWLWEKTADELAKHFRLIMPELRGSGRSDKPDMTYTIPLIAQDIIDLLKELNLEKVHILGVSMGGFVAQYFAATYPEKVASLILSCTTLGGVDQIGPSGTLLSWMIRPRGKSKKERLEHLYAYNFSEDYMKNHPEEIEKITNARIENPQPEYAYYRQFFAGIAYAGKKYANRIAASTLICSGRDDEIVSPENAYALKENIQNSQVKIFEGKHLFFYENHEVFNQLVIEFLSNHKMQENEQKPIGY